MYRGIHISKSILQILNSCLNFQRANFPCLSTEIRDFILIVRYFSTTMKQIFLFVYPYTKIKNLSAKKTCFSRFFYFLRFTHFLFPVYFSFIFAFIVCYFSTTMKQIYLFMYTPIHQIYISTQLKSKFFRFPRLPIGSKVRFFRFMLINQPKKAFFVLFFQQKLFILFIYYSRSFLFDHYEGG